MGPVRSFWILSTLFYCIPFGSRNFVYIVEQEDTRSKRALYKLGPELGRDVTVGDPQAQITDNDN